jgi:TRAP-type mannitol/chloroaromatic compound transport system permease small subunit
MLLEQIKVEDLISFYKRDIKKSRASEAIDVFGHIIFVISMPVLILVAIIGLPTYFYIFNISQMH